MDEQHPQREEGLTPMLGMAISLHEWFLALQHAGFTEEQALRLITHAMTANPGDSQ